MSRLAGTRGPPHLIAMLNVVLAFAFALVFASPTHAQAPPPAVVVTATPEGAEGAPHREQVWRIPLLADEGRSVAAIVFRPPGNEPRPLMVFGHHTSGDAQRNAEPRHGVYPSMVSWFVERGYVVAVVHRRGYGRTGGERAERFACRRPNHIGAGRADAVDLTAAIDGLTQLPFVRKDKAIVVGQSTGGWAAIAVAAENHPAVAGIINFGGGRRGTSGETREVCALDELVRDAALFGKRSRTPSLWLYTENDQSFPASLSRRMSEAFSRAGGTLEFHLLPAFERDGHALLPNPRGTPIWAPLVERFILKFR